MIKRYLILLLFLLPCFAYPQDSIQAVEPVVIEGDEVVHQLETKMATAKGNVKISHTDTIILCDEAIYDGIKSLAYIEGKIQIIKKGKGDLSDTVISGHGAVYDFNKRKAELKDLKMSSAPFYAEADQGEKQVDDYTFDHSSITTCDLAKPHYSLTATKMIFSPNNYVKAYNVLFKVGPVPIGYFPYFKHSLKDKFPVRLAVGKNKYWGQYVLSRWRYDFDNQKKIRAYFDWYEERGKGRGLFYKEDSKRFGNILLGGYHIKDKWYDLRRRNTSLFYRFPERSTADLTQKYLYPNRYKTNLYYSFQPNPELSLKAEYNQYSDRYFLKDFFYSHYENDASTLTYALADYSFERSSLSGYLEKRANRYESEIEYLPQFEYNFYRQSIGESKFYLQSKSSFAKLEAKTPYSGKTVYDAGRLYLYNLLSYPDKIKWLNYEVYAGYHSAYYTHDINHRRLWRCVPETGAGINTNMYKIWDTSGSIFGQKVVRMRHVLTPQVDYDYTYVKPGLNRRVLKFDNLDESEGNSTLELSLANKLQVKGLEEKWDLIYFKPAAHYIVKEKGKGSYWRDITTDLEFTPKKGLNLKTETYYDYPERRITQVNADLTINNRAESSQASLVSNTIKEGETFLPDETGYAFTLGHRYQRHQSSQGTFNFAYDLTSKMRLYNYARYEYNTGDLLEQEHKIRFDLHCWWFTFSFNLKPYREELVIGKRKESSVWFEFTLKAFPEGFSLGSGHSYRDVGDRI